MDKNWKLLTSQAQETVVECSSTQLESTVWGWGLQKAAQCHALGSACSDSAACS